MFEKKENIVNQSVESEITQCYIDYAMSVIVSRALPDVRDWLKPVLRRILYAMYDMKLWHNSKFRKSAKVVWEVMWNYHPHGDSSIYEAMVRLAQPFSLRYPLVDWQWNFGSIDWDWAAAQRYTEARLTKIAEEMLQDIERDTVDWRPNYDSSREEPISLPTKFPNHLCNGTMWIAVWMATNMAPHNLNEVIDASLAMIDNPEITVDEIMEIIKWPDFPTGWMIFDSNNIKEVYSKWRWWIIMRWKVHIEETKAGHVIVIDEVPYQVNKANLVAKIWELVNEKLLDGITDLTDESNKEKIRVTINLRKWVEPKIILTKLYKYTELQSSFNINNVVLVERWIQPRTLNIQELLKEFVTYRREVVYRRSVYDLNKAKDRLHILEWLKKAIDILDDVIHTIRHSNTRQEAKDSLMWNFDFSDPQAEYILMMRLQTLVWLEIQRILDEIKDKQELIDYLSKIVSDPKELDKVVIDELVYIKEEYGDERRTEVSNNPEVYALNGSIKNLRKLEELMKEDVIFWVWNNHEVKVLYQSRINVIPEETLYLRYTHNQDKIVAITDKWELVIERLKDLGSHNAKWPWVDIKEKYKLKWKVIFVETIYHDFEQLVFLTNKNSVKKIKKELLQKFKKFPTVIMNLEQWETIISIEWTKPGDNLWILSKKWQLLLFPESQLRSMWKTSGWVRWIMLEDEKDEVVWMLLHRWEPFIFVHWDDSGKLLSLEDLRIWKRSARWTCVVDLHKWEYVKWWIAIDEWWVKISLKWWQIVSIHSNDMSLRIPEEEMEKLVDWKMEVVYRPWEENKTLIEKTETHEEKALQQKLFDSTTVETHQLEDDIETQENNEDTNQ